MSSTAAEATDFYERVLDRDVLMLLPGGLVLDDRAAIVKAMAGQPWSYYELQDIRVLSPTPDVGVVTYAVVAQRTGSPAYTALLSSTYVRRSEGWKLLFHQQTPR
ncbi:MAG: nuclear transport factor 2 family protein [Hamadaea sp.]|nr:nuclear transport factor 2 family protein [Hamadaea sp.]NUR51926.1 nuclear transport factor 2 family protein [Hamadaea sp.]NUT04264.1 nuclear transport factor 2 family protein [Hamadaea sp.]